MIQFLFAEADQKDNEERVSNVVGELLDQCLSELAERQDKVGELENNRKTATG
ncbi:MAG: hypothetical protein M0028_01985 [Clostridia bacterium]|nr:hypothetical protein [Clostridia bacterium]